jgi:hypothetical protein
MRVEDKFVFNGAGALVNAARKALAWRMNFRFSPEAASRKSSNNDVRILPDIVAKVFFE